MNRHRSIRRALTAPAFGLLLGTLGLGEPARAAISRAQYETELASIRKYSKDNVNNDPTIKFIEEANLDLLELHYFNKHRDKKGKGLFEGDGIVANGPENGWSGMATYRMIDTNTGLPAPMPEVASVLYEVNLDPDFPALWTLLGSSSDAGSNFALPWTTEGFEPHIRCTPLDAFGQPVFVDDGSGGNFAIGDVVVLDTSIPAPAGIAPMSLAALAVGARRRRPFTQPG